MLAPSIDISLRRSSSSPLLVVGRAQETWTIGQLLTAVENDLPGRALTLSGDMGIGKSLLLAWASQEAQARNFLVLEACAYEYSQAFPYFPFVEVLRPILQQSTVQQLRFYVGLSDTSEPVVTEPFMAERIALTGIPLVTALARLFPELPARLHVPLSSERVSGELEKFRLFDALASIFERLSCATPLLLSIDNLQWADSSSIELLLYLIPRLANRRVALLGALRPPQWQQGNSDLEVERAQRAAQLLARALSELLRQRLLYTLHLLPLSSSEMNDYMQALLPGTQAGQVTRFLLDRAEGNPFFLEELIRSMTLQQQLVQHQGTWIFQLPDEFRLPASITFALQQRLHLLSASCLELLTIASLFGRSFSGTALLHVVKQETALQENSLRMLLAEATQASLLMEETTEGSAPLQPLVESPATDSRLPRFLFCQSIVQELLQREIAPARAARLHYAIAQALEWHYEHKATAHAAELATHYRESTNRVAALPWSLLAAEEATRQQAYQSAIQHFTLVLQLSEENSVSSAVPQTELPTPTELYALIGELWFRVGDLQSAATALQSALERQASGPALLYARIHRILADIYRMQAHYEQALAHLQAAKARFAEWGQRLASDESESLWLFKRPFAGPVLAGRSAGEEEFLLLQAQALIELLCGRGPEAQQALWQAHSAATRLGDRSSQAFCLHMIGWIYGWGERISETIRLQQQAHELYIAVGDPFHAVLGAQVLGVIHQALGEMEVAHVYTQRGLELVRRYGVRQVRGWLFWNQGIEALTQGDWRGCEEHLQQAHDEAEHDENTRLFPVVLQARGMLQFKQGAWHEAEPSLQSAIQAATNTDWSISTVALYAYFLAVTGRKLAAQLQLEKLQSIPELPGLSGTFFLPFLVESYLHTGQTRLAHLYLEKISKLQGFLYYGLSVDRVLGILYSLKKDWKEAERAFTRGLELCRRAQNFPEVATILYEQARMELLRGGEARHIRSLCEQAREIFTSYEMQRSAALVDTLLAGIQIPNVIESSQAPARPLDLSPERKSIGTHKEYSIHIKLTAREQEVLQLVSEGHTDREVADVLVVSPRTVHRHLSNIFVKLNVPGRAAAVAYAIRHELV